MAIAECQNPGALEFLNYFGGLTAQSKMLDPNKGQILEVAKILDSVA